MSDPYGGTLLDQIEELTARVLKGSSEGATATEQRQRSDERSEEQRQRSEEQRQRRSNASEGATRLNSDSVVSSVSVVRNC